MLHVPRWLTFAAALAGGLGLGCGQGIYTQHPFPDAGGDDGGDAEPADTAPATDLSSPPLDGAELSTTATLDWQGGEIVTGDARLVIPKNVLASTGDITLTQLSADGTLPGYGGAVGPVFSISKSAVFQRQARFELKLTPDSSIPVSRLALAYIDPKAHLWLLLSDSAYDSDTGVLSAVVNEFASPWIIGPVLRCNSPGECGSATACQGGVCQ